MKTKDIVNIALFATLLAVCAWICIPMTVPFTMQTFAVFLAMLVLGGKQGTIVIFIYLLLGIIGIPVFSGGTAGIGVLLGATGGYMIGWIFLGMIVCVGDRLVNYTMTCEGEAKRKKLGTGTMIRILALFLGLIACYLFGTCWFVRIYANNSGEIGFLAAVTTCVVPFLIPDIIKMSLAYFVSKRIKKVIRSV